MANYWYFREPSNQTVPWEDSVVLVQTRALSSELLLRQEERDALYDMLPGPKRCHVTASDGKSMFLHYSWVRTKEEMLKKVQTWGLKADCNWVDLVNREFSAPFRGADFIRGYKYKSVAPLLDLSLDQFALKPLNREPHVLQLTHKDVQDLLKFKKNVVLEWLSGLIK